MHTIPSYLRHLVYWQIFKKQNCFCRIVLLLNVVQVKFCANSEKSYLQTHTCRLFQRETTAKATADLCPLAKTSTVCGTKCFCFYNAVRAGIACRMHRHACTDAFSRQRVPLTANKFACVSPTIPLCLRLFFLPIPRNTCRRLFCNSRGWNMSGKGQALQNCTDRLHASHSKRRF